MTLDNLKQSLIAAKAILQNTSTRKRIETVAAFAVEAEHKDRIFVEGKASDGQKIGKYSTKAMYASRSMLEGLPKGKFRPRGEVSKKKKFKNGNSRKAMYLQNGYAEFRQVVGRQNGTVDLNLTGTTFGQITTGTKGGKIVYGFTSQRASDIMYGHESRYNKDIVRLTKQELQTSIIAVDKEVTAILKTIL